MAGTTSQALAQNAGPAAQESAQVSDIVVTGSRIARQDYTSSSPIVTVGQEDFQATGAVTIDALVNDLPQFVPSTNQTSNNPSNGGQANIDLRGLGSPRTLVLMNGRRVVPSNPTGTVDTNILPAALIRNIEVISGGASAAYGSDALAGVANFILDDKFTGVKLDAQYGVTDRSDGETESYSLTFGGPVADDRGNMVMSISRSTRADVFNVDREFSRVAGAAETSPLGSTIFDADNRPSQAFLNSYFNVTSGVTRGGQFGYNSDGTIFAYEGVRNFRSPGGIDYDGFATPGGNYRYNTGPLNRLQLPLESWNAYFGGEYEINPSAKLYGSMLFADYTSGNELAATPATGNIVVTAGGIVNTGFRVPVTNPFITADIAAMLASRPNPSQSFLLNKRFNELGGRRATENYEIYQGTVGIRGELAGLRDWTYDIYAQQGRVHRVTLQTGNVSRSSVQALLDAPDGGRSLCAGGFNPFGESNLSAECINYIGRTSQNVTNQDQTVVEATLQGSLLELPAGDLRFAGGIQYRQDNYDFQPDASLARVNPVVNRPDGGQTGGSEIAGFNPQSRQTGASNSTEFFLELLVPVLSDVPFIKQLDLNLGYRLSDYNTVGWVDAYRADVEWEILDYVRFRGGVQRSVRAPSVGELYAPNNTAFPAVGNPSATGLSGDPCDVRSSYRLGPNAAAVRALCLAQGIPLNAIDDFRLGNNQVPGLVGGNPNLTEETSDSFTTGLILTSPWSNPWTSGLSASIDYYNIEITNVIGFVGAAAQLQGCFNARGENPTYSQSNSFCQLFVRDPRTGNVAQASQINGNLGTLRTSGIDAQIDWRIGLADVGAPDWGSLDFNLVVGWLENWERQDVPNGPFTNRTSTIDTLTASAFPDWKALSSVNWNMGDYRLGLRWRYVGEMTRFGTTDNVEATHYLDLTGGWAINDTLSLRASVNNLTDQQPRLIPPGVQANTDPSTYDTLGRRYSIGLTARF